MSKAKRKQAALEKRQHERQRFLAVLATIIVVVAGGVSGLYFGMQGQGDVQAPVDEGRQAALASENAPTIGNPDARVHIVEFLDPACETCALFFPMVKDWLKEEPERLRLSVRHVAFHEGADYVIRVLEASRKQDKYWETLEALLATQSQWAINHVVQPDRVLPSIASVGLDQERLLAEMNGIDVLAHIEQDKKDSIQLKVSATPEYFVNGRQMSSFGRQQLLDLVREELEAAY